MAAENAGTPFLGPDLQTSMISVHRIRSLLGGIIRRLEQRRYSETYGLCNEVGKRLGGGGDNNLQGSKKCCLKMVAFWGRATHLLVDRA